jgi:hypothetical protein
MTPNLIEIFGKVSENYTCKEKKNMTCNLYVFPTKNAYTEIGLITAFVCQMPYEVE